MASFAEVVFGVSRIILCADILAKFSFVKVATVNTIRGPSPRQGNYMHCSVMGRGLA